MAFELFRQQRLLGCVDGAGSFIGEYTEGRLKDLIENDRG